MNENELLGRFSDKKICEVCGDQALSYNFNALTCESCKAFFRRNAFKDQLKCSFENTCSINRMTRKFCQYCRLKKCFVVGMKRELIMSETQKDLKRRKIEANRAKTVKLSGRKINKSCSCQHSNTESVDNDASVLKTRVDQASWTDDLDSENDLGSFCFVNLMTEKPSFTTCSTQTETSLVDSSAQTEDWKCSCSSKSNHPKNLQVPSRSSTSRKDKNQLDPVHQKLLDDLVVANSALDAPLESEVSNLASDAFQGCCGENGGSLLDVINLTAIAIRRLIKMCKRISGFKALSTQDQVSLLKHGCTQMMLLRSVLNFDPDKNSWKIPHNTVNQLSRIKVEVLKEAQGNLYEAHEAFLTTFDSRASRDKFLIYILTAIELFDPTRPNLVHSQIIRQQQDCYYNLLKCYLESEFGTEEADSIFDHLLNKLEELHRLCEDHIRVYLNVNPSQVEPLLIEIFDLKPH